MSNRKDAKSRSEARLDIRLTPEELDGLKALASELKTTVSDLLRKLVVDERARRVERARAAARWGGTR